MIDGAPTTMELNGFSVLYIEATPSRISTSGALPVGRTRATCGGRAGAGAGAANGLGIVNCAEQMSLASNAHENATSACAPRRANLSAMPIPSNGRFASPLPSSIRRKPLVNP